MKNYSAFVISFCFPLIFLVQSAIGQGSIELKRPKDPIIFGTGAALFLTGNYFYRKKDPLTAEQIADLKIEDVNSFDRPATNNYSVSAKNASDILLYSSLALPAILLADKDIRKDALPVMAVYLQSLIITGAEIQFVKGLVDRPRPFVYNSNAPIDEKLLPDADASFFSSHTALTANAATFTATVYTIYHPDSKALPYIYVAAAAIPLTTGYLRYEAGKHFPTDIATGLIVGAINGYLMAKWHKKK